MMKTRLSAHDVCAAKREAQAKSAEIDRIAVPLKMEEESPGAMIVTKCK
jgi:hypothetical protein